MESDDSGSEIVLKRKRQPDLWKRNIAKKSKAEGKAHVSLRGKNVLERTTGQICR